jgi:hypothetical protein
VSLSPALIGEINIPNLWSVLDLVMTESAGRFMEGIRAFIKYYVIEKSHELAGSKAAMLQI